MPVCAGCGASAGENLCCPTCAKGGYAAFFCNQTCFEKNWKQHSKLHSRLVGKTQRTGGDAGAGRGVRRNDSQDDGMVGVVQEFFGAGGKGKPPSSVFSLFLIKCLTFMSQRRVLVVIIMFFLFVIFWTTSSTSMPPIYKHQPVQDDIEPTGTPSPASTPVPGALEAQVREMQKQLDAQGGALQKLVVKLESAGHIPSGEVLPTHYYRIVFNKSMHFSNRF